LSLFRVEISSGVENEMALERGDRPWPVCGRAVHSISCHIAKCDCISSKPTFDRLLSQKSQVAIECILSNGGVCRARRFALSLILHNIYELEQRPQWHLNEYSFCIINIGIPFCANIFHFSTIICNILGPSTRRGLQKGCFFKTVYVHCDCQLLDPPSRVARTLLESQLSEWIARSLPEPAIAARARPPESRAAASRGVSMRGA
jgi:hypothetical protein